MLIRSVKRSFAVLLFLVAAINSYSQSLVPYEESVMYSIGNCEFTYYEILKYWKQHPINGNKASGGDEIIDAAATWLDNYIGRSYVVEHAVSSGYDEDRIFKERFDYMCQMMLVRGVDGPYYKALYSKYLNSPDASRVFFVNDSMNEWMKSQKFRLGLSSGIEAFEEEREVLITSACQISYDESILDYMFELILRHDLSKGVPDFPDKDEEWGRVACVWHCYDGEKKLYVGELMNRLFIAPLVLNITNKALLKRQIENWIVEEVNTLDAKFAQANVDPVYLRNRSAYFHQDLYNSYSDFIVSKRKPLTIESSESLYREYLHRFKVHETYSVRLYKSSDYNKATKALFALIGLSKNDQYKPSRSDSELISNSIEITLKNGNETNGVVESRLLDRFNGGISESLFQLDGYTYAAVTTNASGEYLIPIEGAQTLLEQLDVERYTANTLGAIADEVQAVSPVVMNYSKERLLELLVKPTITLPNEK